MSLNLKRRSGGGVNFYYGDEREPFIRVVPYVDPRFPEEILLRIDAPKDVTVLREELTRRRRDYSPKPPPPPPIDRNGERLNRADDYRRDDSDWHFEEDRA